MKAKLIDSMNLYRGRVFDLSLVRIEEDGLEYEREVIKHPGSAVVLPVHANGDVTLVRQFRYPANSYLLEIPAGTVEEDESPEQCAAREIEEETGLKAKRLQHVAEFFVSPGFLTEKMHLFLAYELTRTTPNRDFDENIETVRISIDEAVEMVGNGSIIDAKTIIGIMLAADPKRSGI